MSKDWGLTELRFSLGGTATQAVLGLLMTAAGAWLASLFAFDSDELLNRRPGIFMDFLTSNGGVPGLTLFSISALCFAYWTIRACWRFFSSGRAAMLTEHGILFHRSLARAEIPYDDISAVDISRTFALQNLYVRVPGRWRIRLQSNEVEGGKEALEAFAAELNARRMFGS